jgi:hypothetical protein
MGFHNLFFSPGLIKVIKSIMVHVARIETMIDAWIILVWKPDCLGDLDAARRIILKHVKEKGSLLKLHFKMDSQWMCGTVW